MANIKRIQFSTIIEAPVALVWDVMLGEESYPLWTAAFGEGSYYEGSWSPGSRIKFLVPTGEGMVAEIAELRPNEFVSIRHLGFVADGVEDTSSEAVRAWAPAYENYTFGAVPEGTKLVVDQDVGEGEEATMRDLWARALALLKKLCEEMAAR